MSLLRLFRPQWSLATRICAGFAALVLLGLIVSLTSVQRERAGDVRTHQFVDMAQRKGRIAELRSAVDGLQIAETNFRLTSSKADLAQVQQAMLRGQTQLNALKTETNDDEAQELLNRLGNMLDAHQVLATRFSKLTRSAEVSSLALSDVGGRLSAGINELVAGLDRDAPPEQTYGVHLIDRRTFELRLASTHFRLQRSATGAGHFVEAVRGVEKAIEMALPKMGELSRDVPPVRDLLHEYAALFATWSNGALEADRIYVAELKPGLDAIAVDLHQLDADFSNRMSAEADNANAASHHSIMVAALVGGLGVAVGVLLALLTIRSLIGPLRAITARMLSLANGELDSPIRFLSSRDELGDMARALEVFRENARRADALSCAEKAAQQARMQRSAMLEKLIADFEASTAIATQQLTQASSTMENTARDLAANAEQTAAQSMGVSSAAAQTSASVQDVAGSTEQLAASIQEISRQVTQSASVAQRALDGARKTDITVQKLADGAHKIGEVVQLINSIAGQTNLLALNATIEAARAGEAGKGFAVVANEVKALANQTARATEEIGAQIAAIQSATHLAVAEIGQIAVVISEINQIGMAIAAAIDEQGAATSVISHNIEQAAFGTQNVTRLIGDVHDAAGGTGRAAENVHRVSASVAEQSGALVREIDRFAAAVKAA